MALVVVLAILVLITGLVLSFFSAVTSESKNSHLYANDAATKALSESVVNIVMGQIREGTLGFATDASGNLDPNQPLAWASQPGAIRTFSTSGSAPERVFKLYSARRLVATGAEFLSELDPSDPNADSPGDWASRPALYTDLNEPAADVTGTLVYPIVDPTAQGQVEGFEIINAPTNGTDNPAPMPSQWLYLLRDGTITSPTPSSSTGNIASWGNGSGAFVPSGSNPIVARIAFWTDDDTSKVNINTASEGTPFDTPRVNSQEDRELATNQPVRGEFQRYPGHPATTSLAPVFFATSSSSTPNPLSNTQREALYGVIPRVVGGGSEGGTRNPMFGVSDVNDPSIPLTPDGDRLYASVDELALTAGRNEQATDSGITAAKVKQSSFFLTAHSRAPETTLFNTPRVSLWPVDQNPSVRSAFTQLAAFAASVGQDGGGNPFHYFFQRNDPTLATADAEIARNEEIFSYLNDLMQRDIPGFGGRISSKLGNDNTEQLLAAIFDYTRTINLNDGLIPNRHRFYYKSRTYPDGDDPVQDDADIYKFDAVGRGQVVPSRIATVQGYGRFPAITEAGLLFICTGRADDPSTPGVDESLGSNVVPRNRTLDNTLLNPGERRVQALFLFETFTPGQGFPPINPSFTVRVSGLDAFTVQGNPMGFPASDTFRHWRMPEGSNVGASSNKGWGGTNSPRLSLAYARLPSRGSVNGDPASNEVGAPPIPPGAPDPFGSRYNFVSVPVTINDSDPMIFNGGPVTIELFAGADADPDAATPVATYTIPFAAADFQAPELIATGTPRGDGGSPAATIKENWWGFNYAVHRHYGGIENLSAGIQGRGRLYFVRQRIEDQLFSDAAYRDIAGHLFRDGDIVQTMVPEHADYRLLLSNPSGVSWIPHPNYETSRIAHTFGEGRGSAFFTGYYHPSSSLAGAGANYDDRRMPDTPVIHPNAPAHGDWDNGISFSLDGPYLNKPDEGITRGLNTGEAAYFVGTNYDQSGVWGNDAQLYESGSGLFSPNRQMPSAGMLGSLPAQAMSNVPYRTLLFRPQPGHPGAQDPPDHLIADLFSMPVVEPYAISEPLATAGKINLNYGIVPHRHLRRATGMAAALRPERVMAIPTANADDYKYSQSTPPPGNWRQPVNIAETLGQFDSKFASGDFFRSATEICDIHLVPEGTSLSQMEDGSFWNDHALTGDNTRERPYANLLGRVTTKSNTYTIHYRVQTLKKVPTTAENQWIEGRDVVLAESRGSTTIERFVDPNDPGLENVDFATNPNANIDDFYRFRVVESRRFAP